MAKPPHWLDGVAKVLRAETDDLRELARIGGVDPRTAYVGTRLDGTDLRGQDLRGMVFSDLDLSRVRHDAGTRIDPGQVAGGATFEATPILMLSSALDVEALDKLLSGLSPLIFEARDASRFLDHVRRGGPALIMVFDDEMPLAESVLTRLHPDGPPVALIIQGRDPVRWFTRWSHLAAGHHAFFCQQYGMARKSRAPSITVDARFLCRLLVDNWDELMARRPLPTLFMRAQGVGPRPVLDAAAQLFDRVWRMRLHHSGLELVHPRETTKSERDGLDRLFGPDVATVASSPSAAGLFVDLSDEIASHPPPYKDRMEYWRSILGAFEILIERPDRRRDFIGASERPIRVSNTEFMVVDPVSVAPHPAALAAFDFMAVERVMICDLADVALVVDRLVKAGELWVTARDMLGVGDGADVSIWSLLAAQMRRFGSQPLGDARQAYLQLILRAAARRSGREARRLEPVLNEFPLIRVEELAFGLGWTTFKAILGSPEYSTHARLAVRIEPEGPFLSVLSARGFPTL